MFLSLLTVSIYYCYGKYKQFDYKVSKQTAEQIIDEEMRVEILSVDPDVRMIYNFLKKGEADHLIKKYKSKLVLSAGVEDNRTRTYGKFRTSSTAFLLKKEDPIVASIEERIAKFTNSTLRQMEPLQIQNYKKGQEFQYHYDYFTPAHVKDQGGQRYYLNFYYIRLHTTVVYLNDVPKEFGGGTSFLHLNLTVAPLKNAACYFRDLHPNGAGNELTLHSGDVVLTDKVEKWIITSWIRSTDFFY